VTDPNVIVGRDGADDAAVYKISENVAIVQTVDYFTPIVDDPYDFGAIAAANALSDVYAMGGRPVIALNIAGFPADGPLPLSVLGEIFRGGADKATEAGVSIVGGHTIDDKEPKYGLSVTGLIHPDKVLQNSGAKVGDDIVLTKPLGFGIITTGIKRKLVSPETIREVVALMSTLNRAAAEAMLEVGVDTCTDVTGFGLLGHMREVMLASGVGARLNFSSVPVLAATWELARQGSVPGGAARNLDFIADSVEFDPALTPDQRVVLYDPQTSGGLLIFIPNERTPQLLAALERHGVPTRAVIGRVVEEYQGRISIVA
jgi:selenide, water dikinase